MKDSVARTIAYVVSRFPKVTETFILNEILDMERLGAHVELFSLVHERQAIRHPGAERLVRRAHYPRPSFALAAAHVHWLRRRPTRYARAWLAAIRGNLGSTNFLLRALVVVADAVWFAREMERTGVERVHAHFATHATLAAYVVRVLTGLEYSFTVHAMDLYVDRTMLGEKIRHARLVVAVSEYNRQLIGRLYGEDALAKTVVVRLGVDLDRFRPAAVPRATTTPVILCVASLEDYKGHRYLLDALALLTVRGTSFCCVLVGEGARRADLERQIARLGLEDRVELQGAQAHPRVLDLLRSADVFALPSVVTETGLMEGIPVALMEAMAMQVPAIATDISGVNELIDNDRNGLLVRERDATALADALDRLLEDATLRSRLGRAGRAKVEREFDLRRNVVALHALLTNEQRTPLGRGTGRSHSA